VTYHLIESPFIKIGRKLSSNSQHIPISIPMKETQEGA
jgi:hypothetical protein